MAPTRHLDPGVSAWALGPSDEDPWLVVCPVCSSRAIVRGSRLVCTGCALDRTSAARNHTLWLSTPCCGETLIAVNEGHLDLLEGYLLAKHRERRRDPKWGWNNRSELSRLPRWMKLAKHREEIARGLARLRVRLGESSGSTR